MACRRDFTRQTLGKRHPLNLWVCEHRTSCEVRCCEMQLWKGTGSASPLSVSIHCADCGVGSSHTTQAWQPQRLSPHLSLHTSMMKILPPVFTRLGWMVFAVDFIAFVSDTHLRRFHFVSKIGKRCQFRKSCCHTYYTVGWSIQWHQLELSPDM